MKVSLFYSPGQDFPSVPPSCNTERFLDALERRDYDAMHHMYRTLLETTTVLHDAITTLTAERRANKPVKLSTLEEFPVYTMTSGGRLWKWNCGWQEFNRLGHKIGTPIGHLQFRKLKPAKKTGDRKSDAWLRLCRPEGPWRRHIDCVLNHPLFGNGKVVMTDGHHALFEYHTTEGETRRAEVIFNTLQEIKVTPIRKMSAKPVNKSPKEPKVSALVADFLSSLT